MTIKFGSTYLSGETAQNGIDCPQDGPLFTSTFQTQEDNIVRGANPERIGRQNQVAECSFSVTRIHTDTATSFNYCESHVKSFNDVGTVTFSTADGSGTFATWTKCTVIATSRAIGRSSVTQYRIRGLPTG